MSAPKHDGGKIPLGLVPTDFLRAIGRVLAFGAKKYQAWSWTAGKDWSRDYDAVLRHLTDWHDGVDNDPESGEPHLAHAACDLAFLLVSTLRGLGKDDRPVYGSPKSPVADPRQIDLPLAATDHLPADKWWPASCKQDIGHKYGCTRPNGHAGQHEFYDGMHCVRE